MRLSFSSLQVELNPFCMLRPTFQFPDALINYFVHQIFIGVFVHSRAYLASLFASILMMGVGLQATNGVIKNDKKSWVFTIGLAL